LPAERKASTGNAFSAAFVLHEPSARCWLASQAKPRATSSDAAKVAGHNSRIKTQTFIARTVAKLRPRCPLKIAQIAASRLLLTAILGLNKLRRMAKESE